MGDASFVTYTYAGLVRNEFQGLTLTLPAGAATISAGGAAANTLSASTQDALQSALATLLGSNSSSSSSNSSSSGLAALMSAGARWQQEIAVDGLSVVPGTIQVHFGSVQQLVALLLGFALGSSCLVVAATALLVRWRYR
jgi:hypothetical protein